MNPAAPRRRRPLTAGLLAALPRDLHEFGAAPARRKLALLRALAGANAPTPAQMVAAQDALAFVHAYPDTPAVHAAVRTVIARMRQWAKTATPIAALQGSGLPGTALSYSYHYGVLLQLVRAWPGSCELDWDELDDDSPLLTALRLCVPVAEADGLDDDRLTLREWLDACRPHGAHSDLETALRIVARAGHAGPLTAWLIDAGDLPTRYELRHPGQGRCEVELPGGRRHYQRSAIERERYALPPRIRAPLPRARPCGAGAARRVLAIAHAALCVRRLEIYPLIHANERDVTRVQCPRGIEVVLVGTQPEFRAALESLYVFVVCKNGVPVGYGPAAVFLGACEMGINLFPEFRGGEIRFVYAQVMRVLHHVLGADYFFLQQYGMGVDNPEAIDSGAFWFYRKLGFVAENPVVERLARAEEQRMRAQPGYRSDRRMLHRLKHTRAFLDLSDGRSTWFDFARLGVRLSEFIARRFGGDRRAAATRCSASVAAVLGLRLERLPAARRRAFADIAPILAMVHDLRRWPAADRHRLARALALRGAASEAPACRALAAHDRVRAALRALIADGTSRTPPAMAGAE